MLVARPDVAPAVPLRMFWTWVALSYLPLWVWTQPLFIFHVMVMRCDNGLIFACTILGMQNSPNGNSQKVMQMLAKIRKSQATIYLLGTSAQIYRIANLKAPLLYMVALSEPKLNENSEHDDVVLHQLICRMLESFHLRWYILYAFVTDLLRKKSREIKRNTFSFIL